MSIYRWLASIIIGTVVLIPLLLISLVASEPGSRWLVAQSQSYLPVTIEYDEFSGTLLNEFQFKHFRLETDAIAYTPEQLTINWQPSALLAGIVRIESLNSVGGEFRLRRNASATDETESGSALEDISFQPPVTLKLNQLTIDKMAVFIGDAVPQTFSINASANIATNGRLTINTLGIEHQYASTVLSGQAMLSYPFSAELVNTVTLHSPDYPRLHIKSQIKGDVLQLKTISTFSDALKGSLTTQIDDPLTDLSWQFDSDWKETDLSSVLNSAAQDSGPILFAGSLSGQGDLQHASVQPDLTVTAYQQTADIEGTVSYQNDTLELNDIVVGLADTVQGKLTFNGRLSSLNSTPALTAAVQWDKLEYQTDDIISKNGQMHATGIIDDLNVELSTTVTGIASSSLALAAKTRITPDQLRIRQLTLEQDDERVEGSGLVAWKDQLVVTADVNGQYRQKPVNLDLSVTLDQPYLFVDTLSAQWGTQSFTAKGALSPGKQLDWRIETSDLKNFTTVAGQLSAAGSVKGQLNQSDIHAELREFQFNHPDYKSIELKEAVTANVDYQKLTLDITPVCLNYPGIEQPLCIQLKQHGDVFDVSTNIAQVPLGLLQSLSVPNAGFKLQGALSADISGSFNYKTSVLTQLDAVIKADNSAVKAGNKSVRFETFKVTAVSTDTDGLQTNLTAKASRLNFALDGQIDMDTLSPSSPIHGSVSFNSESLRVVNVFVPQLDIDAGAANAKLTVSGQLNDPVASGQLNVDVTKMIVMATGTLVTDLNATLTADANAGQFDVVANGDIGDGPISVKGEFNAFDKAGTLDVNGEKLLILDTPDLMLTASPDLHVEIDGDTIAATGKLHIPKARITPVEMNQAVTESADVTLKNEEKQTSLLSTRADITVSLGDNVNVEALGFSGKLQGQLQIIQEPGAAAKGNGTIGVASGKYEIYGQKLTIERGDLIFNGGPLDSPALNLRVTRKIEENGLNEKPPEQIGARVTGTIERPDLSLFSTPSLPDSAILSYLLFGKPPGNQGDANNLELQAALLVGGRGTRFLTEGIKDTFNLDEVSLDSETSDVNDTSLYIGKYLSPRLYIKYGVGLLEPTSTFILRYTLSDSLIFESTSTTESQGGDLIYTIEN